MRVKRKRKRVTPADALELRAKLEAACRSGIDDDLDALQEIIAGGPRARNAQSRVKAIALKLSYGFGQPSQPISLQSPEGKELRLRIVRDRK